MTPPGREYVQMARMYEATDAKPQPTEDRPWRRGVAVAAAPPPQVAGNKDMRDEDLNGALQYFGISADGDRPGGVALDVGCGWGYVARRLAQTGALDVTFGLDVDWRSLEIARKQAEDAGVGPEEGLLMLRGDVQELPFQNEVVDFIFWGMGMHTVQDYAAGLREVARALRPGGKLYATTIRTVGRSAEDVAERAREAGFADVTVEAPEETKLVLRAAKAVA